MSEKKPHRDTATSGHVARLRRDNARLRAWLRRWECRFCCGSGVVAARRVGGYKDPAGRPCDGCHGSGLHPFASAALAGKPAGARWATRSHGPTPCGPTS